ncbi:AT-hook motif nuclear-localized protein 13 [Glycine soja]
MDSREQPQPQPPNMMVGPTVYPSMLAPATARFPYSNNNNNNNSNPPPPSSEPLNSDANTNHNNSTFEALKPCALAASESSKKKRGRPRKYSPDGNIALGLGPTHAPASSADPPAKKHRGRPPGSGKKQMDALGIPGTGFTPHVITAEVGEDIASKLVAFCEQGRRTVCTLSASGAIRNVTIRAPDMPAGILAYEGQFEIISLKAATLQSDNNRMAALSVSIAGPDGRLLGGEVVGALTAATAVQVILGSFIADGKKSSSSNLKSGRSSTPSSQMLAFGASPTPTTPTSLGPSTDSSEDNENSHFSKGPGGSGLYNNNASQPIHTMPMYQHQLWAGHTQQ